jgi:hypothetical protein
MHAFAFIMVLCSFVYAAAVTHVLSTAGEMIIASKRIRLSWFNANRNGGQFRLLTVAGLIR